MDNKPPSNCEPTPLSEQLSTLIPELAPIPVSHQPLLDSPYWAALTTVTPGGQPQTTPIWCNREEDYVLFNTMRGFLKEKNMRVNPRVSLLVYEPGNPLHFLELEGHVIGMTEVGAVEHNDLLTQLYTGKPQARFFGDAIPAEMAANYQPIKVTMAPLRVRTESLSRSAEAGTVISGSIKRNILAPAVEIPASHQDLLLRPILGVLATLLPDGHPYSALVWVDYDGAEVLINLNLASQECQNLQTNPKVTLLVVDPQNTSRYLEVRGQVVELSTDGALDHARTLIQRYSSNALSGSESSSTERLRLQTRAIVKIRPLKVTYDAFFNQTRPKSEALPSTG